MYGRNNIYTPIARTIFKMSDDPSYPGLKTQNFSTLALARHVIESVCCQRPNIEMNCEPLGGCAFTQQQLSYGGRME